MKARLERTTWLLAAIAFLALTAIIISIGRQLRQIYLNRALIAAIKKQEEQKAIGLLEQGADANTVDRIDKPLSIPALLADLRQRIQGGHARRDEEYHASALMVLCATRNKEVRWEDSH